MRKKLGLVLVACFGLAWPAAAQLKGSDATPFEIGGGYTYRSFNAQTTPNNTGDESTEPHIPMNGWFATAAYNFADFFGVVTDIDWTRANVPNNVGMPGVNTFSSVMIGPQIYPIGHHRITPFAHVEFGLTHNAENISNTALLNEETGGSCGTATSGVACTYTDGSFGIVAGGGVDFSLTRNLAVRLAQFDWEQSRMFEPGAATGNSNQNNWKVKAGVIVRF